MTSKNSWWYRASKEERLAQIDGGIECGMTAKQIAMNCRAHVEHDGSTVGNYARNHGRSLPTTRRECGRRASASSGYAGGLAAARRAGKPDYEIVSAFSIFDDGRSDPPMFDEVPA